ncbi:MAG: hypothetical protein ACP5RP_03205 [Candidatus Micrarchaeia archaeon]
MVVRLRPRLEKEASMLLTAKDLSEEEKIKIKAKAMELLQSNNLSELLSLAGVSKENSELESALKTLIAERVTEYIIDANEVAKKKRLPLGPAALIIAAERSRW